MIFFFTFSFRVRAYQPVAQGSTGVTCPQRHQRTDTGLQLPMSTPSHQIRTLPSPLGDIRTGRQYCSPGNNRYPLVLPGERTRCENRSVAFGLGTVRVCGNSPQIRVGPWEAEKTKGSTGRTYMLNGRFSFYSAKGTS